MFKWVGIGLGVLTILLIACVVGLALAPLEFRQGTRDIFIIILGLFQLIAVILLAALLVAVIYAVRRIDQLARTGVLPKLDEAMLKMNEVLESGRTIATQARDSTTTVSGSTSFVAERVVSPVIRISSLVTGVRAAATSLARRDAPERLADSLDQPPPTRRRPPGAGQPF